MTTATVTHIQGVVACENAVAVVTGQTPPELLPGLSDTVDSEYGIFRCLLNRGVPWHHQLLIQCQGFFFVDFLKSDLDTFLLHLCLGLKFKIRRCDDALLDLQA